MPSRKVCRGFITALPTWRRNKKLMLKIRISLESKSGGPTNMIGCLLNRWTRLWVMKLSVRKLLSWELNWTTDSAPSKKIQMASWPCLSRSHPATRRISRDSNTTSVLRNTRKWLKYPEMHPTTMTAEWSYCSSTLSERVKNLSKIKYWSVKLSRRWSKLSSGSTVSILLGRDWILGRSILKMLSKDFSIKKNSHLSHLNLIIKRTNKLSWRK